MDNKLIERVLVHHVRQERGVPDTFLLAHGFSGACTGNSQHFSVSVGVFTVVAKVGSGLKRGTVVKRFHGRPDRLQQLFVEAESYCRMLEGAIPPNVVLGSIATSWGLRYVWHCNGVPGPSRHEATLNYWLMKISPGDVEMINGKNPWLEFAPTSFKPGAR